MLDRATRSVRPAKIDWEIETASSHARSNAGSIASMRVTRYSSIRRKRKRPDSRDGNRRSHCTGVVGHLVFAATSNWPGWIYFRRDFAARPRGRGICAGNLRVASRPLYLEMGSSDSRIAAVNGEVEITHPKTRYFWARNFSAEKKESRGDRERERGVGVEIRRTRRVGTGRRKFRGEFQP